jgi:hypothetical protein
MTLVTQLKEAITELEAWQANSANVHRRQASLLYWAAKVSSLAGQVAEEATKDVIEEMKIEEITANQEDNEDE